MSTARRQLGTGPSATRNTPTMGMGPRLLPVERVEPDALLGELERPEAPGRKGRRILGPGVAITPEGVS